MKNIAILGIHTGIGKTIASAVIAEALGADYWKPVQAGLEERDTDVVSKLLTNGAQRIHPEAVRLTQPLSPHAAAAIDNIDIDITKFDWPETGKTLIVESAGGVLSPISAQHTVADFVAYYQLPCILVVQHYLGSISHTLLCIEVLKNRGIKLLGIIVNGGNNELSESFIDNYSGVPVLARIPLFETLNSDTICHHADQLQSSLSEIINSAAKH